jgi:hypothetical protein
MKPKIINLVDLIGVSFDEIAQYIENIDDLYDFPRYEITIIFHNDRYKAFVKIDDPNQKNESFEREMKI